MAAYRRGSRSGVGRGKLVALAVLLVVVLVVLYNSYSSSSNHLNAESENLRSIHSAHVNRAGKDSFPGRHGMVSDNGGQSRRINRGRKPDFSKQVAKMRGKDVDPQEQRKSVTPDEISKTNKLQKSKKSNEFDTNINNNKQHQLKTKKSKKMLEPDVRSQKKAADSKDPHAIQSRPSDTNVDKGPQKQPRSKPLKHSPVKGPESVSVIINSAAQRFRTHPLYLSLGLDSNLIRNNWEGFNFNSVRLQTLARGLAPAVVRLMGTDGDRMTFEPNCTKSGSQRNPFHYDVREKGKFFPKDNFTMSCRDWDLINQFSKKVGWRLLFGINSQTRYGKHSRWNSTNFRQLLEYSIKKGYASNLDFEFGNEPDIFKEVHMKHVTDGARFARDYRTFQKLLHEPKYKPYFVNTTIGGPGLAKNRKESLLFLKDFMKNVGNAIDVVTWHHSYGGYNISTLEDTTDPDILDSLRQCIRDVKSVVHSPEAGKRKRIWLAETSSTWAPPGNNVSKSYAMGFMLLDKLGMAAQENIELVVRQKFYGFGFALVHLGMRPTPGYWTSYLFRTLVGRNVLNVTVPEYGKRVRMYAHCTNILKTNYPPGSVTLFGMNLYDTPVNLNLGSKFKSQLVHEYIMTPYNLFSGTAAKYVAVNGLQMVMPSDKTFPDVRPRVVQPDQPLILPARTYAFYVLPGAYASACTNHKHP